MRPRLIAAYLAALITTMLAAASATAPMATGATAASPVPRTFTGCGFDTCETPIPGGVDG